jgi:hypothetical protein
MTKTRLVETITRWAVLAGLVMPWGVILAWLASGLARQ